MRVENLKYFSENVEIEYKRVLGYSKTRWLTVLPAVENILIHYITTLFHNVVKIMEGD